MARPKKEITLSNAERKRMHRERARLGAATAETIDAALLAAFKSAYYTACCDTSEPAPDVFAIARDVLARFPSEDDASKVCVRLGMPVIKNPEDVEDLRGY